MSGVSDGRSFVTSFLVLVSLESFKGNLEKN